MDIVQFRQRYPQYTSLSDNDLASQLYSKFYSTMDRDNFLRQFMGPIPDSVFEVDRPSIGTTIDLDPSDIGKSPEPSRLIQQPDPVFERNLYDTDVSRYGSVPRFILPESMGEVDPEIAARGFERSAEVSKFEAEHPDADLRAWLTARLAPAQAVAGGLMQQAGEALSFVGDMIPDPISTLLSNPELREQLKQDDPDLFRRTEALQVKVRGVRDSFLNNPAIAKASGWLIDRAEINRQIGHLGAPEQEQLRALYDAAGAVPDMAFEIAAGLLGGSPIALTTMFTRVYIDELGRSKRIEGLGAEEANMNAAVSAMAEVLPEIPVFNKIFGRAPGAKAGMKDALNVMLLEGGSEMVTELINIADETLRQGKPFSWDEAVKRVRMAGQTGAAMGPMMLGTTSVAAKAGEIYGRIPMGANTQDLETLLERSSGLMNTYNESPSGGVLPAFDAAFNQATRDVDAGLDKVVQDEAIEIDRLSAELDRQFAGQDVPLPEVAIPVLGQRARAEARAAATEQDGSFIETNIDPQTVQTDPVAFQYKTEDIDSEGTDKTLSDVTEWNPAASSILMVWERADGRRFVVDGHQRLALAKRLKDQRPTILARVYREADGHTKEDMRVRAAVINIAQNTGSVVDAAKIIREVGKAGEVGGETAETLERVLPKSGAINKHAPGLAKLDENAFQAIVNEIIKPEYGALVGDRYTDPAQQLAAIDGLAKTQPETMFQATDILDQIDAAGFSAGQTDIFGDTLAESYFKERAKIVEMVGRRAKNKRALYGGLVRNEGKITGVGKNRVDTKINQQIVAEQDTLLAQIGVLARSDQEINNVLNTQAKQLGTGQSTIGAATTVVEGAIARYLELGGTALARDEGIPERDGTATEQTELAPQETLQLGEYETQYTISEASERRVPDDRRPGTLQGELFTPEGSVLEPNPAPRVKLVQTGTFRTGITQATTPQDIAHVAAPLRKEAQENLIAVVTDGEGQVLSVIRHTIGGGHSSQVYPGIVSGAVASIPGAKNAWFVHNHPSGAAKQSRADITITTKIDNLLRGSGINSRGMIVVAPGGEASYYNPKDGSGDSVPISITPQARGSTVPVSERKLRNLSKLEGDPAESATTGRNLIQRYSRGRPGVMLLDTKHNPLKFVPVSRKEMGRLRTGNTSTGVAKLLRIAHESNAKSGLISAPFLRGQKGLDEVRNLGGMLSSAGIRPLDAFDSEGKSLTERHEVITSPGDLFYSRSESSTAGLTVAQLKDAIAKIPKLSTKQFEFVQTEADIPNRSGMEQLRSSTNEGLFDPATGKIHLIAENIASPERAAWVAWHEQWHRGGRVAYGNQFNARLDAAGRNTHISRLANAILRERADDPSMSGPNARRAAIEEALAELNAAQRTGDYDAINDRYGIQVPTTQKAGWRGLVARFYEWLTRHLKQLTGSEVSNAQVFKIVRGADMSTVQTGEVAHTDMPMFSKAPQPDFSHWTLPTQKLSDAMKDDSLGLMDKALKGTANLRLNARQWAQDKMIPVRRIQEAIEKSGATVSEFADVYEKEQLLSGRVEDQFKRMEAEDLAPLVALMKQHKVSRVTLGRYLHARHARSRNERIAKINENFPDGGSGMMTAEAHRILLEFGRKKLIRPLENMAQHVDRITTKTRQNYRNYGLVDEQVMDSWETGGAFNRTYVPLRGFADALQEDFGRPGKGFDIRGDETKRALGRKSEPGDIIGHVLSAYKLSVIRGEKNRVGQALLRLAIDHPNSNLWEINPVTMKTVLDKETGMTTERADVNLHDPNVFYTKVNGKAWRIELKDPRLAVAMKSLGSDSMKALMRGLSTTTRYLSLTRTMLSPEFIITNFMRDIQTAGINLSGEQGRAMVKAVINRKAITHSIRAMFNEQRDGTQGDPEWRRYAREYTEDGGRVAFFRAESVEELARKVDRMSRMTGNDPIAISYRGLKATFKLIEDLNLAVENAVRLASYKAARENGASRQKAAVLAKNLTVNFNRKGTAGPNINALFMFANASIQGAQRMLQASKSPRIQKVLLGSALFGAMLTIYNELAGGEDDDGESFYSKIPDFEKGRKLILMIPDGMNEYVRELPFMNFTDEERKRGAFLTIHLPYGYSIPYVMGEGIASTAFGTKPTEAALRILSAVNNSFNPVGGSDLATTIWPTLADPFVEIYRNKNFFGGPIHREKLSWDHTPAPKSGEGFRSTAGPYKYVAKKMNAWSGGNAIRPGGFDYHPETYRHFLEFAFGGTGTFFERVADNVSAALSPDRAVDINRVPFLRSFFGTTRDFVDRDRYYANIESLGYLKAEYEQFYMDVRNGDMRQDRYDQWKADHKELLESGLIGRAKSVEKALSMRRKALKRAIENNATPAAIKKMEGDILRIQIRFNTRYNKATLDKGWLRSLVNSHDTT